MIFIKCKNGKKFHTQKHLYDILRKVIQLYLGDRLEVLLSLIGELYTSRNKPMSCMTLENKNGKKI